MATLTASGQVLPPERQKTPYIAIKILGFAAILGAAVWFVRHYVFSTTCTTTKRDSHRTRRTTGLCELGC
jgi:hypothetical protein